MTDISRLRGITTEEIEGLRKKEIRTVDDLWARIAHSFTRDDLGARIGEDFDRAIDQLARQAGIKRARLIDLLGAHSIHHAGESGVSATLPDAITPQEVARLRNQGIKTLDDLWLWIGKDFNDGSDDDGIDRLAEEVKIDSRRLIELLADQSIREANQRDSSWPNQHLSLIAWLVSLIVLGLVVGCALQVVLPLLGLRSSVVVAARDLEPSRGLRSSDLSTAPLLWNADYFMSPSDLEGLMLAQGIARGKPLRFQDLLRPQLIAARDIDAGAIVATDAISLTWSPYQPGAAISKDQVVGHRVRHAFRKGEVILSEFVDSKHASMQRLAPRIAAAISAPIMSPEATLPWERGSPWPSPQRRT